MNGKSTPGRHDEREYQGVSITSVDVLQQKFRLKFRGYDAQDVDSFLELVAREMERIGADNLRLRDEIGSLKQSLEVHKKKEESINAALLTVQKLADDVKIRAAAEAETILRESKHEAEAIVNASRAEAEKIRAEARANADQLLSGAQQMGADVRSEMLSCKEQAEQEARVIVEDASRKAAQAKEECLREQSRLQEDISLLKQQKFQLHISLKSVIENHLKLLESEEQ